MDGLSAFRNFQTPTRHRLPPVTCVPSHPRISLALTRSRTYPDNTGRNVSLQRLAAASLFSCSEDFAMIEERECGPGAQAGPDRNRPGYRLTTFESNEKTSCTLDSNTYAPLVFNGIGTNNKTKYLPTNNPEIKCLAATPKSPTQWNQIGTRLHPCFVPGNPANRARNLAFCRGRLMNSITEEGSTPPEVLDSA
jgi:hypothetical protein